MDSTLIFGLAALLLLAAITVEGGGAAGMGGRRRVRVGVDATRSGARVTGEWSTGRRNWRVGVSGNVDTRGNWGAGVRASWRFKKRSIDLGDNRFEILINMDACHFDVYDIDGDGNITREEIRIVFYEDAKADKLFQELDKTTNDGRVDKAEFQYMAPRVITNCVAAEVSRCLAVQVQVNQYGGPEVLVTENNMTSFPMRAVRVNQYGGPEVMVTEDNVEIPTPTDTQVLVGVKVAGINPMDTAIRAGGYPSMTSLPYTPGKDGAGVVNEIGSKVTKIKPGDNVYFVFAVSGAYAQYCTVEEQFVQPLGALSFEQGAAMGIPYYTAVRSITHCAKRNAVKDNTILIHGASGAVGLAGVQIAKALGMKVYGTAGSKKGMDLVSQHGATQVFNHRQEGYIDKMQAATQNKGFDIILEILANKNLAKDMETVAQKGIIVVIGGMGEVEIDTSLSIMKECSVTGVMILSSTQEDWHGMHTLVQDGIQAGWLKPHVSRTYTMEEAPQSHIDMNNTSSTQGKIVLKI